MPITITLQQQEWDQILSVLGEAPFKVVANVIGQIQQQGQQQLAQQPQQAPRPQLVRTDEPA